MAYDSMLNNKLAYFLCYQGYEKTTCPLDNNNSPDFRRLL